MPAKSLSRSKALLVCAIAAATIAVPLNTPVQAAKKKAPATVQTISAKDKALGTKAHPQLVAEFGGAMTGLQAKYVETVGKNIALQSGLSNAAGDFTVTTLNSPVNNAFAIPGGFIYTTRQLVALMNNEAELAGVLGHEVGHVAARHAKKRQSAATRNGVIGVLGTILSGVLLGDSALGRMGQQVFSEGSQLLTLSFSRAQETESDNLGIAYLNKAGYDPRAMSTVLQSLANQNALESRLMGGSGERVPEWASTHPDPASRVRAALARAGASATGRTNRDTFLSSIDGVMYGDDPEQGVVEGRDFTHPSLKLAFQSPAGFFMVNGTRAVSISGQSGKAQFTGAAYNGDLNAYIRAGFASLTEEGQAAIAPQSVERTTVNGLPAAYGMARVNNGQSQVEVVIFAYEFAKDQAFHFIALAPAGQANVFNPMFSSMKRISDAEAARVKPRMLDVLTVKSGDTVQSLATRMAYSDAALERFLVLNGLTATSRLNPGDKVKIVRY